MKKDKTKKVKWSEVLNKNGTFKKGMSIVMSTDTLNKMLKDKEDELKIEQEENKFVFDGLHKQIKQLQNNISKLQAGKIYRKEAIKHYRSTKNKLKQILKLKRLHIKSLQNKSGELKEWNEFYKSNNNELGLKLYGAKSWKGGRDFATNNFKKQLKQKLKNK